MCIGLVITFAFAIPSEWHYYYIHNIYFWNMFSFSFIGGGFVTLVTILLAEWSFKKLVKKFKLKKEAKT